MNLRSQEVRTMAPEGAQMKHTAVPKEMHSAIFPTLVQRRQTTFLRPCRIQYELYLS